MQEPYLSTLPRVITCAIARVESRYAKRDCCDYHWNRALGDISRLRTGDQQRREVDLYRASGNRAWPDRHPLHNQTSTTREDLVAYEDLLVKDY